MNKISGNVRLSFDSMIRPAGLIFSCELKNPDTVIGVLTAYLALAKFNAYRIRQNYLHWLGTYLAGMVPAVIPAKPLDVAVALEIEAHAQSMGPEAPAAKAA